MSVGENFYTRCIKIAICRMNFFLTFENPNYVFLFSKGYEPDENEFPYILNSKG
jgi:hypothetical protein